MPYEDVLVHRATPVSRISDGEWVEGERMSVPVDGVPFDCCLFLPQGTETAGPRQRRVREPTLLIAEEDDAGVPIALQAEDELRIVAPELNAAEGRPVDAAVRWLVVGSVQLFGKPGDDPIGGQVTVRQIDD